MMMIAYSSPKDYKVLSQKESLVYIRTKIMLGYNMKLGDKVIFLVSPNKELPDYTIEEIEANEIENL